MEQIQAWINANPVLFTLIVWPLVTALVGFGFRKISENPRLSAFGDLLHAAGFDAAKVVEALKTIFGPKPPAPPIAGKAAGFTMSILLVIGIACATQTTGCTKQQGAILETALLEAEPLACALLTTETDSKIVADLCKVPPDQIDKLIKLLAGKERAGFGKAKATGLAPAKCP